MIKVIKVIKTYNKYNKYNIAPPFELYIRFIYTITESLSIIK